VLTKVAREANNGCRVPKVSSQLKRSWGRKIQAPIVDQNQLPTILLSIKDRPAPLKDRLKRILVSIERDDYAEPHTITVVLSTPTRIVLLGAT
jgi:hypothetical protein